MINLKKALLLFWVVLLSGCVFNKPKPGDPKYAPVPLHQLTPPKNNTGSIYQANYSITLFEDRTARRIGDILTVKLVESTKASKSATTGLKKDTDFDIENPTLLGQKVKFSTPKAFPLESTKDNNLAANLVAKRKFDGSGDSAQNNQLDGVITVTVSQVLPNGNLIIRGEKWLTLNRGDEYIRLTGIVRPDDIEPDNSVLSTRIANAQISYSGTGEVADANKAGWLARFFISAVWPF